MAHRDDAEALRAKLEAAEAEAAASAARAAAAEEALRVASERVDFLERELAKVRGNQPARPSKPPRARPEPAAQAAVSRTPDKRLRDAEQFAAEGRSREAMQIVLSVRRQSPQNARAAELLASRVHCARCRKPVAPPGDGAPAASARFFGGRCPLCAQMLDLLGGT